MSAERLQKVLAGAGVASRRRAEELILAGRVSVDGKIVRTLGTKADPRRSRVEVDGKRVVQQKPVYGVLHKPRETVCTLRDPEGRHTVGELLRGVGVRVVPVGRLDYHTSGVLLFTNDGDFARVMQQPSTGVSKVYVAKVRRGDDEKLIERFSDTIVIEGGATRPAGVRLLRHEGNKTWLEITLLEGKNRQIRRLGEHAKSPVMRLARTSQAGITIEGLRPGQWRMLSADELRKLKKAHGVPRRVTRSQSLEGASRGGANAPTKKQPRRAPARRR
jgi:23S rRNA pseudouridine2605 synthase